MGSFWSILACPQQVRLVGNLGGWSDFAVDGVALDEIQARVAIRYDKLAANYLAFIKLASIRIWLRANESAPPG